MPSILTILRDMNSSFCVLMNLCPMRPAGKKFGTRHPARESVYDDMIFKGYNDSQECFFSGQPEQYTKKMSSFRMLEIPSTFHSPVHRRFVYILKIAPHRDAIGQTGHPDS